MTQKGELCTTQKQAHTEEGENEQNIFPLPKRGRGRPIETVVTHIESANTTPTTEEETQIPQEKVFTKNQLGLQHFFLKRE